MITPREARLLRVVETLQGGPTMDQLINRALDRLEAEIRTKDAHGHEHVSSGPQGGQFTSGGGGGGPTAQKKRQKRQPRKRKPQKTATGGGKAVDTRVKIEKREMGPKDEARAGRAKEAYDARKSNIDVVRYGERQEAELIKKLGGTQGSNNGAIDVVRRMDGVTHGLEVKTIVNKGGPNKSGLKAQLKMEADQLKRKQTWVAQSGDRRSGVVAMDHRDRATSESGEFIGNKEAYSGHDLYYRRDFGAHRLGAMYKVKSIAELKSLMAKSDDELRDMVQSDKKYKGLIGAKK